MTLSKKPVKKAVKKAVKKPAAKKAVKNVAAKKQAKKLPPKKVAKKIAKAAPKKLAKKVVKKAIKAPAKKAVKKSVKAVAKKIAPKKAAKKLAAKKPIVKKLALKKVAAKKPVAKKPAAKKPAVKKTKIAAPIVIAAPKGPRYPGPVWPLMDVILDAVDDAKAEQVVAIHLEGRSSMADGMVIASGRANRHVAAIADQLVTKLKAHGQKDIRVEGLEQGDWVLVDAGNVIVHIFRPEVRSFYNLEKLWSEHAPAEHGTMDSREE